MAFAFHIEQSPRIASTQITGFSVAPEFVEILKLLITFYLVGCRLCEHHHTQQLVHMYPIRLDSLIFRSSFYLLLNVEENCSRCQLFQFGISRTLNFNSVGNLKLARQLPCSELPVPLTNDGQILSHKLIIWGKRVQQSHFEYFRISTIKYKNTKSQ